MANGLRETDVDGSTVYMPPGLKDVTETMGQVHDQYSIALYQRPRNLRNDEPLQVFQAELDSLRAQKAEAVRRLDGAISTLEAALAVLRRDS